MHLSLIKKIKIKKCDLLIIYDSYTSKKKTFIQSFTYNETNYGTSLIVGLKYDEKTAAVPVVKTIFKHKRKTLNKLISYSKKAGIQVVSLNKCYDKDIYSINKKIPYCKYKEIAEIYSRQRFSLKENTTHDIITKFTKFENFFRLKLGYALIPLVDKGNASAYLPDYFCKIRDSIYYETGIILPVFYVCDEINLKPMEFEFIISGKTVLKHDFEGLHLIEAGLKIKQLIETEIKKKLCDIITPRYLVEYLDNYDSEKLLYKCIMEKHIPEEFILKVIHECIRKNKPIDLDITFDAILNNYSGRNSVDQMLRIIEWFQKCNNIRIQNAHDIFR